MIKKVITVILTIGVLFLTGCEEKKKTEKNYSEYSFTGVNWVRDGFIYYCSCGNPVNDSDLCETYTYNEDTKEIKLDCFETTEDTITLIKVVSLTDTTLELDFNGELRRFEKESN